jgi:hypothetical protein
MDLSPGALYVQDASLQVSVPTCAVTPSPHTHWHVGLHPLQSTEAYMLTLSPLVAVLNVVGYVTAAPSCIVSATGANTLFGR